MMKMVNIIFPDQLFKEHSILKNEAPINLIESSMVI